MRNLWNRWSSTFALSVVISISIVEWCVAEDIVAPTDKLQLLFTSQGKTGLAELDGSDVRYLALDKPGQATWQPGPVFPDGRRMILLSMELRRDGPGRSFEQYYHQTPTHLWQYDLQTGSLDEICQRDRIAPFTTPAMLLPNGRILIQVVKDKIGQIYSVNLDGSDPKEFTKPGEGLPYGFSLSPDGKRVAFHLASPNGYQVYTCEISGANRVCVASNTGHLYFGTNWSPDGQWIVYVDCHANLDLGHDWADICIGRPDGSEHKVLTTGQSMWFAATYGDSKTKGGGSNIPAWTRRGEILFPQRKPHSKVPWQYRVGQPDLDHFNREYKPNESEGSTRIVRLNPVTGEIVPVTEFLEGQWDFRATESHDGRFIVFCRAKTGEPPAIWVVGTTDRRARLITKGLGDLGADHPKWISKSLLASE